MLGSAVRTIQLGVGLKEGLGLGEALELESTYAWASNPSETLIWNRLSHHKMPHTPARAVLGCL